MSETDRFEHICELFDTARGLDDAGRSRLLSEVEPEIRTEVESLLRQHDAHSPLDADTPGLVVGNLTAQLTGGDAPVPERIAAYTIVCTIGEGGMGTVYEARQADPERAVALKIIKLGMDTKQVIARFEAERQALALMDHPNIARVYDAGATEGGRPFFAMELVRGEPIIEYCDEHTLDTRSRLELFCQVCRAIQHAHQKGVIHRDIKPSNVLVTEVDGSATPKVIDFGIAKATDTDSSGQTLMTAQGQAIGTPAYMSPEQAAMGARDIDTRSDIYSLGVLLYELLTGTTPFRSEDLQSVGFAEMLRILQEVEPEKPSTRLSSLGDEATRKAERRGADERSLRSVLEGDLDWIVMRCLEKDRSRRYESASGLGEDIRRYLADEPIEARPHSTGYRMQKFVRRNRGRVITAGVAVGILILGVVGTTSGMLWALKERDRATKSATAEKQSKLEAKESAELATKEAENAQELSTFFIMDVLSAVDPARMESRDITVREALVLASRNVEGRFDGRPEVETNIQNALGYLFGRLGAHAEAEVHQRRLWELAKLRDGEMSVESARTLHGVVGSVAAQGRNLEAIELTRDELSILEPLHSPEAVQWRIRAMGNLGALYLRAGRESDAAPILERTLEIKRSQFGDRHATTLTAVNSLAGVYNRIGRHNDALVLAREAYEGRREVLGVGDPRTLTSLVMLGSVLDGLGRPDEAQQVLEGALLVASDRLGSEHPGVLEVRVALAANHLNAGALLEAEKAYRSLLTSQQVSDPEMKGTRVVTILRGLASTLSKQGRYSEGLRESEMALRSAQELFPPESLVVTGNLREHGKLLTRMGHFEEAEAALGQAWATITSQDNFPPTNRRAVLVAFESLYVARHEAEPGAGHDEQVKVWRERLKILAGD